MATPASPLRGVRFAAFQVDLTTGELWTNGRKLNLQVRPFQVLAVLLERPGELVTREELMKRLWPEDTFMDFDHSLNKAVNRLREVLEDSAEHPRIIETLPRRGYRFIAQMEALAPPEAPAVSLPVATAAPDAAVAPSASSETPASRFRKQTAFAAVILILAGAGYFAGRNLRPRPQPPAGKIMLAVLPFQNLTGDPEQEYFSDGLTEEMITVLGGLQPQRLGVIARTSVMPYKHADKPVGQIGRELGVQYLLEGSVRRDAGRVRISAQLIQVKDETHVWADNYQRDLRDILSLQNQVAEAIAGEIQLRLTAPERARLATARPVSPEAHEAYLKGLYSWNKFNEQDLRQAIVFFQQAIHLDPSYAEAYASLGACYGVLGTLTALPPSEGLPRNREAARKALEIDDTLSEGHAELAYAIMLYDYDWPRAEKEFRRAIELNPSNANAHSGLAEYFVFRARFEDAMTEIERARQLDPVSLIINFEQGWYLHFAGRDDEAIAQFRRTLEMDPSFAQPHMGLGNVYAQKGEFDRAIAEYQTAIALPGQTSTRIAILGHAYAAAGRKNEARNTLKRLKEFSRREYVSPYHTALIYAGLGEKDEAFRWLEKAYNDHYWQLAFLKVDPRLDPLRSDKRFQDLMRRVGLPQ